jgi:phage replication initiation protein
VKRRPAEAFEFSTPGSDFSSVGPGKSGPTANRGQKGRATGFAIGIDYLTVTFPLARLEECGATDLLRLAEFIFGGDAMLRVLRPTGRALYRYKNSCCVVDREGTLVGRVAFGGNAETVLFELSGEGCRWIKSWSHVHVQLEVLHARISRCDVALDDFEGVSLKLRELAEQAAAGLFNGGGRPPKTRFLDDHGNLTGCTLYVGKKGHKELCIYEKGKQLKDESSPWLRIEQRFYGKHVSDAIVDGERPRRGLPLDILINPLRYFRGAHAYLADLCERIGLRDAANKLVVVKAKVEATAKAMVKWFREQCGPSLNLVVQALGDDADAFVRKHLTRESLPSRFKGLGAANDLHQLLRAELCHVSM